MRQGIQYVVGTPPQTPVLRPLRQPIFDSEIYPAAGVRVREVFVDRTTFANGTAKDEADTNLTANGSLGTPLEFDLVAFNMEFEIGMSFGDFALVYNNGVWEFFFGQNTVWLDVKDTRIPNGTGVFASLDGNAAPTAALSNGWPSTKEIYNVTTPDRKARRVTSNENFKVRKTWPDAPVLSTDRKFTCYMQGILYTQL